MDLKQCLQSQLVTARGYSERLLSAFHSPEEWTHQVHPHANHPLWFAGHMAVFDNFLIGLIDAGQKRDIAGYQEKFGPGSQPTNRPADYPPAEEVLAYMRERRAALLSLLESLSEADLARPTPPGTPDFLKDWGSIFKTASWHEGVHSGQVSVARRALGHDPLVN